MHLLRTLAFGSLSFALALTAKGETVDIGVISFDQIVPANPPAAGVNGFTIDNLTDGSLSGNDLSAVTFKNSTVLLNGTNSVSVGDAGPGSLQPNQLQFPSTDDFTSALFTATLSSDLLTVNGVAYAATSANVTSSLLPSSGNDLQAGVDFAVISIDANPVISTSPEPATLWLAGPLLGSLGLLSILRSRRRPA